MSHLIEIKITPINPTPDVVTTQEAKDYCRVDFDDDDSLFDQLIASSRQRLEQYCSRVFCESNCVAYYGQQGCGDRILLSFSDNIALNEGNKYIDDLVGESYIKTGDHDVKLEYTAGYSEVPSWIKTAVLMDVAWRYENRGDTSISSNPDLKAHLAPFVKWSLI